MVRRKCQGKYGKQEFSFILNIILTGTDTLSRETTVKIVFAPF